MSIMVQIGLATNNYYLDNSERIFDSTNHSEEIKLVDNDSIKEAEFKPESKSQDKSTIE